MDSSAAICIKGRDIIMKIVEFIQMLSSGKLNDNRLKFCSYQLAILSCDFSKKEENAIKMTWGVAECQYFFRQLCIYFLFIHNGKWYHYFWDRKYKPLIKSPWACKFLICSCRESFRKSQESHDVKNLHTLRRYVQITLVIHMSLPVNLSITDRFWNLGLFSTFSMINTPDTTKCHFSCHTILKDKVSYCSGHVGEALCCKHFAVCFM